MTIKKILFIIMFILSCLYVSAEEGVLLSYHKSVTCSHSPIAGACANLTDGVNYTAGTNNPLIIFDGAPATAYVDLSDAAHFIGKVCINDGVDSTPANGDEGREPIQTIYLTASNDTATWTTITANVLKPFTDDINTQDCWDTSNFTTFRARYIKINAITSEAAQGARVGEIYIYEYYSGADTTPPTISFIYPANGTGYSSYNGTIGFTSSEISNCSVNDTRWSRVNNQGSLSHVFYYSGALSDGIYNINASCNDTSWNRGSNILTFMVDANMPLLYVNNTNNDYFYNYLNLNISATDSNLYSLYVNVSNSTAIKYQYSNTSIFPLTSAYLYSVINTSSWQNGTYRINAKTCDGHTLSSITPYAASKLSDGWNFITKTSDVSIRLYSSTADVTAYDYEKLADRYSLNIDTKADGKSLYTYVFIVTSSNPITYLQSDRYKAWMITGDNWIDFQSDSITSHRVDKINEYSYRVTLTSYDSKIRFDSIGEINCAYSSVNVTKIITPTITLSSPANNSALSSSSVSFGWITSVPLYCSLYLNSTNLINTSLASYSYTLPAEASYNWNVSCISDKYGFFGTSQNFIFTYESNSAALELNTCEKDIGNVMILWLVVIISMFFITIGFVSNTSIYGFLGGIMMFICAWYVSGCEPSLGFITGIVGVITSVLFALKGMSGNNA